MRSTSEGSEQTHQDRSLHALLQNILKYSSMVPDDDSSKTGVSAQSY